MKWLVQLFKSLFVIHFTPDNQTTPVLRWGRYHRVRGSGFFMTWPLIERTLSPVKTSIHVGNFYFEEVLSRDNIPFTIQMTILFTFKPDNALKSAESRVGSST